MYLSSEGNANIPLNKKLTRQRKEIFPGYEKLVQERSKTSCDEREEHQDEEKVVPGVLLNLVFNPNICLHFVKRASYQLTFCIFFQAIL